MQPDSKRLVWRMPICVLLGIGLSVGLNALGLPQWLFLLIFTGIAIVIATIIVYVESQIVKRTGIQPGMRVIINVGRFEGNQGLVMAKKSFGSLPLIVKIDNYEHLTSYAQDELTQIKE